MGYTLELGYAEKLIQQESGYVEIEGFEKARVRPQRAGSTLWLDPDSPKVNEGLDIAPYEYGDDPLEAEDHELPMAVDDDGKVPAEMDVTFNYSKRIREVIDAHLSDLHGQKAAEGAAMLMELIAGLDPDEEPTDYWSPTDGNIRKLTEALLDWTFQHPDAVFRSVG